MQKSCFFWGLLLSLTLKSISSSAQTFTLSATVGSNLSDFLPWERVSETAPNSSKIGYQAGLSTSFNSKKLTIESGVLFENFNSRHGYSESGPGGASNGYFDYSINYLQIPLNFLYTKLTNFGKIVLGGGPYVSFGLSGTMSNYYMTGSSLGTSSSGVETTSYKFNQYIKSDNPDYGLKIKAGVFFGKNLSLTISFDHGMRTMFNGQDNNNQYMGLKNNVVGLNLGYAIF